MQPRQDSTTAEDSKGTTVRRVRGLQGGISNPYRVSWIYSTLCGVGRGVRGASSPKNESLSTCFLFQCFRTQLTFGTDTKKNHKKRQHIKEHNLYTTCIQRHQEKPRGNLAQRQMHTARTLAPSECRKTCHTRYPAPITNLLPLCTQKVALVPCILVPSLDVEHRDADLLSRLKPEVLLVVDERRWWRLEHKRGDRSAHLSFPYNAHRGLGVRLSCPKLLHKLCELLLVVQVHTCQVASTWYLVANIAGSRENNPSSFSCSGAVYTASKQYLCDLRHSEAKWGPIYYHPFHKSSRSSSSSSRASDSVLPPSAETAKSSCDTNTRQTRHLW